MPQAKFMSFLVFCEYGLRDGLLMLLNRTHKQDKDVECFACAVFLPKKSFKQPIIT